MGFGTSARRATGFDRPNDDCFGGVGGNGVDLGWKPGFVVLVLALVKNAGALALFIMLRIPALNFESFPPAVPFSASGSGALRFGLRAPITPAPKADILLDNPAPDLAFEFASTEDDEAYLSRLRRNTKNATTATKANTQTTIPPIAPPETLPALCFC